MTRGTRPRHPVNLATFCAIASVGDFVYVFNCIQEGFAPVGLCRQLRIKNRLWSGCLSLNLDALRVLQNAMVDISS